MYPRFGDIACSGGRPTRRAAPVRPSALGGPAAAVATGRPVGDTIPGDMTLTDLLRTVLRARTGREIAAAFDGFTVHRGLAWGAAGVRQILIDPGRDAPGASRIEVDLQGAAEAAPLIERFERHAAAALAHLLAINLPIIWDASGPNDAGAGEFHPAIAAFASAKRIELLLRLPGAVRFEVCFDTPERVRMDHGLVLPVIAQVQVLAMHLTEAAAAGAPGPALTPREAAFLHGVLRGATVFELSQAFQLAQADTRQFAAELAGKLRSPGRHHAAARALHRGLLAASDGS
jgi:hypothetical protein